MINKEFMDTVLPVVADSWQKLRKIDVFRLLNSIHYLSVDSLNEAGKIIVEQRPDLKDEVAESIEELASEMNLTHT